MELSFLMKFRIAAAAAVGVVLIGILAWPLIGSPGPAGIVSLDVISFGGGAALVVLAFVTGVVGYFVSWPYGLQIGILAVPAGLSFLAIRSGSVADYIGLNPTSLEHRQALFALLRWEPLFWLFIVAAGFAGVLAGHMISHRKDKFGQMDQIGETPVSKGKSWLFMLDPVMILLGFFMTAAIDKIPQKDEADKPKAKPMSKADMCIYKLLAMVTSGLVALILLLVFAQDVKVYDDKLGAVMAQPAIAQIVFAVFMSFAIAAFVVKKFFKSSFIWPILSTALIIAFAVHKYASSEILQHLVKNQPASFFSSPIIAILPVQMVALGTLGSIAGYWMAIRYNYWRKHEAR